ncbi:hypothetical protein O181_076871 [Austropuccinia psidii MF-1]|uniref:CCHC-type domain-containing protein n=1 Tax=Austropuccinia psidii MF-1 TaxID=1389203 RepID=A0A9Q3FH21_9BASI|nr:hypothetical protein [Austropuccinia psidii MF-1]
MGQALLKEVPKLKEWPHFSGEGEYDHMEFIKGIEMIKEDFELPERFVTATFKTLIIRSAHRWYLKLRQAHGHQNRLTALYPDMSEFMIHRKILRKCGGELEHAVKSRTTEQSSEEDIINVLEEVTTRTKIGSSRVNLKTRFNTPWRDSVDKNTKENSNNAKYKSAYTVRKCQICQRTTHLANKCPKRAKINEIDIEKEPDVEKDDQIDNNSDEKSSIFSECSKDIENINATFDIMESDSHLPQLSNGQLDLSKGLYAQLMKTKPNRGEGYTAGNYCMTEVVIEKMPTKNLIDPGAFCSCLVSPVNLELEKFKYEQFREAEIRLHLTDKQEIKLSSLLYDNKGEFYSGKEPLGGIIDHEADIILNIEIPYPPLLRRPAYPATPKSIEALETHIKELLDLGVIQKVGHNE